MRQAITAPTPSGHAAQRSSRCRRHEPPCSPAEFTACSTKFASAASVARWYDPSTGEFTTVDPMLAQTDEPYEYAGDDPVNGSDPSGDWANICHGLLWTGWAFPGLCALGSAIAELPGPKLYRFGTEYETAAELQADAAKAQAAGLPFGVSVWDRKPSKRSDYSTAQTSSVEQLFHIAKTRGPNHYTITLPNPVTPQVALEYNQLFGRHPVIELGLIFVPCSQPFQLALASTPDVDPDLVST